MAGYRRLPGTPHEIAPLLGGIGTHNNIMQTLARGAGVRFALHNISLCEPTPAESGAAFRAAFRLLRILPGLPSRERFASKLLPPHSFAVAPVGGMRFVAPVFTR